MQLQICMSSNLCETQNWTTTIKLAAFFPRSGLSIHEETVAGCRDGSTTHRTLAKLLATLAVPANHVAAGHENDGWAMFLANGASDRSTTGTLWWWSLELAASATGHLALTTKCASQCLIFAYHCTVPSWNPWGLGLVPWGWWPDPPPYFFAFFFWRLGRRHQPRAMWHSLRNTNQIRDQRTGAPVHHEISAPPTWPATSAPWCPFLHSSSWPPHSASRTSGTRSAQFGLPFGMPPWTSPSLKQQTSEPSAPFRAHTAAASRPHPAELAPWFGSTREGRTWL